MKKEKLKELGYNIPKAYIHTLEIRHSGCLVSNEYLTSSQYPNKHTGELVTKTKVNVNKFLNNDSEIFKYSDFSKLFKDIIEIDNIKNFGYKRIDVAFNSYNTDDFEKYLKLNNFIVMLLSMKFKTNNNYRTQDLFIPETHSIAIKKNDTMEAEIYNKQRESQGKSKVQSRLELRRLRLYKLSEFDEPEDLYKYWCNVLDELPSFWDALSEKINTNLADYYYKNGDKLGKTWSSLNGYITLNNQNIFSSKQLINLFKLLNSKNPTRSASNYKQNYKIEYFSKSDLKEYIYILKSSLLEYFFS